MILTDTDWTCRSADWQQTPESGNTKTNLKMTQRAAAPNTSCAVCTANKEFTAGSNSGCVNHGRAATATAAISWRHPSRRNATCEIYKKLPNQNSINFPSQISKALFVINSKLSMNAHCFGICPDDGRKGSSGNVTPWLKSINIIDI